jgi:ABC-type transport system substrate-binding protein
MYYGATPFIDPDSYLFTNFSPGQPRNVAKVNDPVLTDLLVRQRRTQDAAARRRLIHEIQRHVAVQQYIMEIYSPVTIFVWDAALKNYGPNLGYDDGGRLVAAWLDR